MAAAVGRAIDRIDLRRSGAVVRTAAATAQEFRDDVERQNVALRTYQTIGWSIVDAIAQDEPDDSRASAAALGNTLEA